MKYCGTKYAGRSDQNPIYHPIIIHAMSSPPLRSLHPPTHLPRHHVSYRVREKSEDPCSADGHRIPRDNPHRGSHRSEPTHLHQSVSPLVYLHANEMTN